MSKRVSFVNLSDYLCDDEIVDALSSKDTECLTKLVTDFIANRVHLINIHYPKKIVELLITNFEQTYVTGDNLLYPRKEKDEIYTFYRHFYPYTRCSQNNFTIFSHVGKDWKEMGYVVRNDIKWLHVISRKGHEKFFMQGELYKI